MGVGGRSSRKKTAEAEADSGLKFDRPFSIGEALNSSLVFNGKYLAVGCR